MKSQNTIVLNILAVMVLFWAVDAQANSNGPGADWTDNPISSGNCTACHGSFPLNSGAGNITLNGLPASYVPGTSYPVTVQLTDPQASRWGFQATAVTPANQTAGSFTILDPVNTHLNNNTSLTIVMQTATGTHAGTPASSSWTFNWTAPNNSDGAVFHVAANAANSGGTTSGDYIYTHSINVPAVTTPVLDLTMVLTGGSPVPAIGGQITYDLTIHNPTASPVPFDAWIDLTLPNMTVNTLITRTDLTIPSGATIPRSLFLPVQAGSPPGQYALTLKAGDIPTAWHSAGFNFTKNAGDNATGYVEGMFVTYGWDDDEFRTTPEMPENFALIGVYPNPFNPTTSINFELPEASKVMLTVYDVNGRLVNTLVDGSREAGVHDVTFDASGLPSGVYLYRLDHNGASATGKMLLMK